MLFLPVTVDHLFSALVHKLPVFHVCLSQVVGVVFSFCGLFGMFFSPLNQCGFFPYSYLLETFLSLVNKKSHVVLVYVLTAFLSLFVIK